MQSSDDRTARFGTRLAATDEPEDQAEASAPRSLVALPNAEKGHAVRPLGAHCPQDRPPACGVTLARW